MKTYIAPKYTRAQLELLDEGQVQFPFSDEDGEYIGRSHQYQLTNEYFIQKGYNLEKELDGNNPEKVNNFLEFLRIKFYNYIYTNSGSSHRQLNYIIAKSRFHGFSPYEYRQEFLEAMYIQGLYLLNNGDISQITGIDLDTMQNMSIDVIRNQKRDMSPDAMRKLMHLGLNYYGRYKIMPQGKEW